MAVAKKENNLMEKIVSLAKRRGFIFPDSEIYGGLANTWDYGPLGVELKNNIKKLWWERFVHHRSDIVGLDSAIIMNPKVWEASGHLKEFKDPLVECKKCHRRFRADQLFRSITNVSLLEAFLTYILEWQNSLIPRLKKDIRRYQKQVFELEHKMAKLDQEIAERKIHLLEAGEYSRLDEIVNKKSKQEKKLNWQYQFEPEEATDFELKEFHRIFKGGPLVYLENLIKEKRLACPNCSNKELTHPANFNLMFKTFLGSIEDEESTAYLRPETAQGMFLNFKNILDTTRKTIPFGIAQIGKAFRNEITPGNFIFRTREFEMMEIEYFVRESEWEEYFHHWRDEMRKWIEDMGIDMKKVHEEEIPEGERAHYSKRTIDFEYEFPFGRKELYGLAYRGDFDLKAHFKSPPYKDPDPPAGGGEAFYPHVIEPTWGVDRSVLAVLLDAHDDSDKERTVLHLKPRLAPFKAAVFPLLANKPELMKLARKIYEDLRKSFIVDWDDRGNIGKRYYSQDEIGTPFCITVDFESVEKNDVTVRDRDTMEQKRVPVAELKEYFINEIYRSGR